MYIFHHGHSLTRYRCLEIWGWSWSSIGQDYHPIPIFMWQGCLWKILQAASCKAALVQSKCFRRRWTWHVGQAQGMNIWWPRGWERDSNFEFQERMWLSIYQQARRHVQRHEVIIRNGRIIQGSSWERNGGTFFLLWLKATSCHWLAYLTLETGYWHLRHCAYIDLLAHESIFISQMYLATRSTTSLQSIRAILFQPTQR